jgi:hypothetical protein
MEQAVYLVIPNYQFLLPDLTTRFAFRENCVFSCCFSFSSAKSVLVAHCIFHAAFNICTVSLVLVSCCIIIANLNSGVHLYMGHLTSFWGNTSGFRIMVKDQIAFGTLFPFLYQA